MRDGSVCDYLKKTHLLIISIIALFTVIPSQADWEDPTRPPTTTVVFSTPPVKTQRPQWVLTSTLVSAQRNTAVINDTVVSRGDRINGAKIMSIQPSVVRLHINGQDITLMMLKKNIKSLSRITSSRQGK